MVINKKGIGLMFIIYKIFQHGTKHKTYALHKCLIDEDHNILSIYTVSAGEECNSPSDLIESLEEQLAYAKRSIKSQIINFDDRYPQELSWFTKLKYFIKRIRDPKEFK